MIRIRYEVLIPKLVAIIIVSLMLAWMFKMHDTSQTAKLNTMSPEDYVAHKRQVYQMSYFFWFGVLCVYGAFYTLIVEAIAFLIRAVWPRPNPFFTDDKPAA
jgi:hypothetical protein